jgi:hypothetical protein
MTTRQQSVRNFMTPLNRVSLVEAAQVAVAILTTRTKTLVASVLSKMTYRKWLTVP